LKHSYKILICGQPICVSRAAKVSIVEHLRATYRERESRAVSCEQSCWPAVFLCLIAAIYLSLSLSGCTGAIIHNGTSASGSLQASPNAVSFGAVPLGKTVSSSVALVNQGSDAVQVSTVTVSGQSFSVTGAADLPVTVAAGGTYNLNVNFAPVATGAATGQLTIASNASTDGTITVDLSGTGIAASATGGVSTLSVSAANLSFGTVEVNTSNSESLTLSSTGTAAVTVNTASVTGTGFTISGVGFPLTLSPGQTATLSVQFDPAAAGPATGQITFTSDSSAGSSTVVNLSGTGTAVDTAVLSGLNCVSTSINGPATDSCTVNLNGAAGADGLTVALASNDSAVAVPATVTVAAGATSASFTATVAPVVSAQTATLTANAGGVTENFSLQLGASIAALSVSATSISFGNVNVNTTSAQQVTLTSTGVAPVTISAVTISGAGFSVSPIGTPQTLSANQTLTLSVQFDPTAAGAATGQLNIVSNASSGGSITISLSGTGTILILPTLASLSCASASLTGAATDACTVKLSGAAPAGGIDVSLASSSAAVTVPSTVLIPVGASSASFTATVAAVSTATTVILTASAGIASQTFTLTLDASVPTLSVNATTIAFGDVTLDSPSTQSLTLSSTGTASVTVSSAAVSGAGFSVSGITFPLTLSAGQTATLSVEFDPTAAGAVSGSLTLSSNSSTGTSTVVNLTGTGVAASAYEVNLQWDAPTSSTDPVAGYNVYRAPSGSTSYELLNASPVTKTAYTDNNVTDGQTYDYVVESVDAEGNTSAPSNMAAVTIP